jgi:two-component system nitrate/nitrite response regulator NarL
MIDKAKTINIIIADDHPIFRDGLKALFSSEPEFQIVGEACDGDETIKLIESLKPDVLLLDPAMPRISGLEVLRRLANAKSKVRAVMLSEAINAEEITEAFQLGARGVLLKEATTSLLFKCIRTVMAGQYWVGRQGASNLIQTMKQYKKSGAPKKKNYGLTPRELEIIRAVASGYANKEIAGQLSISEQTVKHHLTSIFDKLGVYNRLELTLFIFNHSMVEE